MLIGPLPDCLDCQAHVSLAIYRLLKMLENRGHVVVKDTLAGVTAIEDFIRRGNSEM